MIILKLKYNILFDFEMKYVPDMLTGCQIQCLIFLKEKKKQKTHYIRLVNYYYKI